MTIYPNVAWKYGSMATLWMTSKPVKGNIDPAIDCIAKPDNYDPANKPSPYDEPSHLLPGDSIHDPKLGEQNWCGYFFCWVIGKQDNHYKVRDLADKVYWLTKYELRVL